MSIEGRISDIEFDLAERTKTLGQIARDNKFVDTGDMGRWLVRFRQNELWRKLQLYGGTPPAPPKREKPVVREPVRPSRVEEAPHKPTLAEILEEAGLPPDGPGPVMHTELEYPEADVAGEPFTEPVDDPWAGPPPWEKEEPDIAGTPAEHFEDILEKPSPSEQSLIMRDEIPEPWPHFLDPEPTPSPRKEPVVAQQVEIPPAPPGGWKTAHGANEHRGGRPITYADMVWSYLEAGATSPKKRTSNKAMKLIEQIRELMEVVDEEAEEVKALARISELEALIAIEKAKLKGEPAPEPETNGHAPSEASDIRKWARFNDYEVPDRGPIPTHVRVAYDAAHDGDEGLNDD